MSAGRLDPDVHERMLLASVQEGKRPWMRARGHSMGPAIPDGAFVQLQPPGDLRRGDVVAALVPNRQLIIHRVLDVDGERVLLKGDALLRPDQWLQRDDVIAHVRRLRVDGRERGIDRGGVDAVEASSLVTDEVLTTAPSWSLPTHFQLYVGTFAMRPALAPGTLVWVRRTGGQVGDVVVLRSPAQGVSLRRVVARREGRVLVRADVSPAPDGWLPQRAVLGVVEGRRLPLGTWGCRAVADTGWQLLLTYDRVRRMLASRPPRGAPRKTAVEPLIRPLVSGDVDDEAAYREAREATYGPQPHTLALPGVNEGLGWGAFVDGQLAGAAVGLRMGRHAVRSPLFVVAEHRGAGLGRRLVAAAVEWAQALPGVTLFWASIHVRNTASIKTFLAEGFTVVDEPGLGAVYDASHGEFPTVTVARWWNRPEG